MMLRLKALLLVALACACAGPASAQDGQEPPVSMTTDDVIFAEHSETKAINAATAAEAAAKEAEAAASPAAKGGSRASAGYVRVITSSGYSFERPNAWAPVPDLIAKDTPGYFRYDAIFQDPKTGAVVSAISVDRTQLQTAVDVGDPNSVNTLLATMLNPGGAKDGVRIFRQTTGTTGAAKWLRVKAQGTGRAVDGTAVDTTFWVQFVQTDAVLAMVAVAYPTGQADLAARDAFHTVRTLEVEGAAPVPSAKAP